MYNYDQILASGYYVFRDDLTTSMVSSLITLLINLGARFKRDNLRIKELKRILVLNGDKFSLNDGFILDDIIYLVDNNLVLMFQELKDSMGSYSDEEVSKKKIKIKGTMQ